MVTDIKTNKRDAGDIRPPATRYLSINSITFSGGIEYDYRKAITLENRRAKSLISFRPVSQWVLMCKKHAIAFQLVFLQLYAPASEHSDE